MHHFLWSWLKDGAEMFLCGDWLDGQLELLYTHAERFRLLSKPTLYVVCGRSIRVADRTALQALKVNVNLN
mgnify:FL=1